MPTLRFEPIAIQLGKFVSAAKLFPSEVVERIEQERLAEGGDSPWPPDVRELMLFYTAVLGAAKTLLGAPQFERLARLSDAIDAEYQPGGPPKSPVYGSHAVQHILGGVPQGLAGETPYSVLARLSSGDPPRARLHELASNAAGSHQDLYRVTQAQAHSAELERVRAPGAVAVRLTGAFLSTGDRVLARVLTFGGKCYIADSPYLLEASERDWLDYLSRVADSARASDGRADAGPAASPKPSPRLTPKQAARLRQQKKLRATPSSDTEVIGRHLAQGPSERFWFDYVMAACAGERRGIVRLAGVPDRPETLPHDDSYAPVRADTVR